MSDVFAALFFALAIFSTSLHAQEIEENILISKSHSSLSEGVLLGDFSKLDPLKKPSENFDLLDWSLTLPTDLNKDKKADTIYEKSLDKGFNLKPFFYTADDGGLVFASPNVGAKTSKNTKYTRTELREMLRRGNGRIKTRGMTKNNWVFSNAHGSTKAKSGGVEGSFEGTLAINRVSTTGDEKKVGRVVIGQIHATDDEPIRLYYRKLPGNSKGAIYFAHEINDGDDIWINMIGSRSHTLSDPDDIVIADANDTEILNEDFETGYVDGEDLSTTYSSSAEATVRSIDSSINLVARMADTTTTADAELRLTTAALAEGSISTTLKLQAIAGFTATTGVDEDNTAYMSVYGGSASSSNLTGEIVFSNGAVKYRDANKDQQTIEGLTYADDTDIDVVLKWTATDYSVSIDGGTTFFGPYVAINTGTATETYQIRIGSSGKESAKELLADDIVIADETDSTVLNEDFETYVVGDDLSTTYSSSTEATVQQD